MDLETILLLLFLLLPLFSRLFGKKQPPSEVPPPHYEDDYEPTYRQVPPPDAREPAQVGGRREAEDPLADALRQIREALGEPAPPPQPTQAPPSPPPPPRQRPVTQQSIPQRSIPQRSIPQRSVPKRSVPASATVPTRGSIPQTAVSQSRLEATARKSILTRPIDPGTPLVVETVGGSGIQAGDLMERLRSESSARQAILMKEILDRPLGMRRGHR